MSRLQIIEKNIFGTLGQVSHSKKRKKKLGKIPNSKILTLWHDYFMPGVTMEGSGVTPDNNLKKDFLGHCDQCPNRKINKKILGKSLLTGNILVMGLFVTS